MKQKIRKTKIIIISMYILGLIGLGLISYNYILSKVHLTFETVNLQLYGNKEPKEINTESTTQQYQNQEKNQTNTNDNENNNSTVQFKNTLNTNQYIAYLEIPKINLKQGLLNLNDSNNNVDKNIQTIYPSAWPDKENSNLILASHSGNSRISYFKNLYKLTVNDNVYIYYKNIKYTYKITNTYNTPKNGEIPIYRNTNKTTITLITCTKNNDELQTVYIGYLENKEGVS